MKNQYLVLFFFFYCSPIFTSTPPLYPLQQKELAQRQAHQCADKEEALFALSSLHGFVPPAEQPAKPVKRKLTFDENGDAKKE